MKRMINKYLNEVASGRAFMEQGAECGFLTSEQVERIEQAKETIRLNKEQDKMVKNLVDMAWANLKLQGIA